MTQDGCPGPAQCPLFCLSHDPKTAHLGCVRGDMAKRCRGSGDRRVYWKMHNDAWAEISNGLLQRLFDRSTTTTGEKA